MEIYDQEHAKYDNSSQKYSDVRLFHLMHPSDSFLASLLPQPRALDSHHAGRDHDSQQQNEAIYWVSKSQGWSRADSVEVEVGSQEEKDEVECNQGKEQTGVNVVDGPPELEIRIYRPLFCLSFAFFEPILSLDFLDDRAYFDGQNNQQHHCNDAAPHNIIFAKLPAQSILFSEATSILYLRKELSVSADPTHLFDCLAQVRGFIVESVAEVYHLCGEYQFNSDHFMAKTEKKDS